MLIALIGESCSGKSTIAQKLREKTGAEIYTGKDYLRLDKNEAKAKELFMRELSNAAQGDRNIVYVISEKEHLALLPGNAVKVLVSADIETVISRFTERMKGNLPAPVEKMLRAKHGLFDGGDFALRVAGDSCDVDEACEKILGAVSF